MAGATMLVMLLVSLWMLRVGEAMATADGELGASMSLSLDGIQRLKRCVRMQSP